MKPKHRSLPWLYTPAGEATYQSGIGLVTLFVFLWLALSSHNQRVVFGVSLMMYLVLLTLIAYFLRSPNLYLSEVQREVSRGGTPDFLLVGVPMGFFGSFVALTHSMATLWPGQYFRAPIDTPASSWVLYGFDNIIRATLLDFGEIFFIDVSRIDHEHNLIACTIVFSFRTILSIGLVVIVFKGWKKALGQTKETTPISRSTLP